MKIITYWFVYCEQYSKFENLSKENNYGQSVQNKMAVFENCKTEPKV